jgi:hypothetical protein
MRKTSARISLLTRFWPPIRLALESHFQYSRKPPRCQPTTVLGVTTMRGPFHPAQSFRNTTQNSLCNAASRRRGRLACRATSCWRRARFSRRRSSRELRALKIQPRRCRSGAIMAGILPKTAVEFVAKSLILRLTPCFDEQQVQHDCRLNCLVILMSPLQAAMHSAAWGICRSSRCGWRCILGPELSAMKTASRRDAWARSALVPSNAQKSGIGGRNRRKKYPTFHQHGKPSFISVTRAHAVLLMP